MFCKSCGEHTEQVKMENRIVYVSPMVRVLKVQQEKGGVYTGEKVQGYMPIHDDICRGKNG